MRTAGAATVLFDLNFNKRVGTNGDVGIWHETYRSRSGDYENVYVNMPRFGLGKVGTMVEAASHARAKKDAQSLAAATT